MLAAELTVSLRQGLLMERKQKTATANAVLKRKETSLNVTNIKQYPDRVYIKKEGGNAHTNWNEYFDQGYHSRGW
jgi:hypothetical protein